MKRKTILQNRRYKIWTRKNKKNDNLQTRTKCKEELFLKSTFVGSSAPLFMYNFQSSTSDFPTD